MKICEDCGEDIVPNEPCNGCAAMENEIANHCLSEADLKEWDKSADLIRKMGISANLDSIY